MYRVHSDVLVAGVLLLGRVRSFTGLLAALALGVGFLAPPEALAGAPLRQARISGRLDASLLTQLKWRHIGPGLTSGRIADIAVVEEDTDIIYIASSTGGLWKTLNHGTTWEPVFENGNTASLGAVALAPANPNIVWVGTGEPWGARSNSWGDGVYKSEDGGKSWRHMGLTKSRHVGRIVIHPERPEILYVAALGSLWGASEDRGLFKTTDGGQTWTKVLHVSHHTGVVDVAMDPRDPDVLYAAAYQRERRNWSSVSGGPESALFKSTDGGTTWSRLTNGLPKGDVGRIGLAICPSQPDTVYAVIDAQARERGTFRSVDRGASWERRNSEVATRSGYGQVRCDPHDPERVYVLNTRTSVSEDGGRSFRDGLTGPGVHGDERALWIDPSDSDHLILGTDGGVYLSQDRGRHWDFMDNIPVTQFYTVAVDLREPFYYVYGGTQDQSSYGGPSATRNVDGITNADWFRTIRGDGFYAAIDPTDATVVYSEAHYGRMVRFDTRTGEQHLIQPQAPEGERYRWNWSSPFLISHYDHQTVYFAANKVFKSTNRGDAWEVISPDLTRQLDHFELPLQGRVWPRDSINLHGGTSEYGNITTLSESLLRPGWLAVGTDDGLIWVSRDDGANWVMTESFPGVAERTRVSRVMMSSFEEETLYAVFDAHKDNDFRPYVLKSTDLGRSWQSITGNLPEFSSTRVLVEHPRNPNLLFVGTEFGVFVSITGGGEWVALKNNLPTVPVHGMVVHPRENDLVIGTHGRGFWIVDDIGILETLSAEALQSPMHLAPPRPAMQFHRFDRGRGNLGHQFFSAPNPPDGAILTYYVNPEVVKEEATEELTTAGDGGSTVPRPFIHLDIVDERDNVVRRLAVRQGVEGTGIQRVVWDLRHPLPYEAAVGAGRETKTGTSFNVPYGPFVLPGEYGVRLKVGERQQVEKLVVRADPAIPMGEAERRDWHDLLVELTHLQATARAVRATAEQMEEQLETAKAALALKPETPSELVSEVERLLGEVAEIARESRPEQGLFGGTMPSRLRVVDQINMVYAYVVGSTAPPTQDQRRMTRQGAERLQELVSELTRLSQEALPALHRKLDQHRVPWTPGRPLS